MQTQLYLILTPRIRCLIHHAQLDFKSILNHITNSTIQSVYLWGTSLVMLPSEFESYQFTENHIEKLNGVVKLVLLGSPEQINTAVNSITQLRLNFKKIAEKNFAIPTHDVSGGETANTTFSEVKFVMLDSSG